MGLRIYSFEDVGSLLAASWLNDLNRLVIHGANAPVGLHDLQKHIVLVRLRLQSCLFLIELQIKFRAVARKSDYFLIGSISDAATQAFNRLHSHALDSLCGSLGMFDEELVLLSLDLDDALHGN